MSRSIQTAAALLAGSLAVLVTSASRSGGSTSPFTWPPPPADILQIAQQEELPIPPGGLFELLTVPEDRYLVLEWAFLISPESDPLLGCGLDVLEEHDGALTLKSNCVSANFGRSESGTGAVFRPGSSVVIHNDTGQTTTEITIQLIGYFRNVD